MDVFSKFMSLYPLQNPTQITIRNCLSNYFSLHGCSNFVLSDNAKNLVGKTITEFFQKTGVIQIKSSPFASRARGFIERRIRSLQTLLRIFWDQYGDDKLIDISQAISIFGYSLNNVPFEQSILTPYNIQFGSIRGLGGDIEGSKSYLFQKQYLFDEKSLETRLGEKAEPLLKLISDAMEKFKEKKLKKLKEDNRNRIDSQIRKPAFSKSAK